MDCLVHQMKTLIQKYLKNTNTNTNTFEQIQLKSCDDTIARTVQIKWMNCWVNQMKTFIQKWYTFKYKYKWRGHSWENCANTVDRKIQIQISCKLKFGTNTAEEYTVERTVQTQLRELCKHSLENCANTV